MDFNSLYRASTAPAARAVATPKIPGLEVRKKQWFTEILPALEGWGQNVLFLGQSNMGKSYFLKKLLKEVKPERMIVISNTFPDQYRLGGLKHFKHYSIMPDCIEDMDIQPHTYVIIDDIRVMALVTVT